MQTLFKVLVGSHAYGTAVESSDTDFKRVYHEDQDKILGFGYRPQIEINKDDTGYEIARFLELLKVNNPTILEILFTDTRFIQEQHLSFQILLDNRHKFLTKKCKDSFGGYAAAQIRKARGLDKKQNWLQERVEKREPIDFCYIIVNDKTFKFTEWLTNHRVSENQIGLINLDHAPHCAAVFISWTGKYKGVFGENSDFILTSSVPKGELCYGTLVYNRDAYKIHCKDWQSYQIWVTERNTARYVDNIGHGQKIDSKNLMHTRRLLDMAAEIAVGDMQVLRPNRDYLLSIRRGEVNLDDILKQAEEDILKLDDLYAKSDLPDEIDQNWLNELLLNIRKKCLTT